MENFTRQVTRRLCMVPDGRRRPAPTHYAKNERAEAPARTQGLRTLIHTRYACTMARVVVQDSPKLTAVAVGHLTGQDFYNRLEQAIDRSERAKLIEGRVIEHND